MKKCLKSFNPWWKSAFGYYSSLGCILLVNTIVASIAGWLSPGLVMAGGGIAMGSFALAAVVARIRQKME